MTDRIENLRDIYSRLGGPDAFRESQTPRRGTAPTDADIDRDIRALVGEMRQQFEFRTTLSDTDLVAVVRGFFDGQSDRDIATVLDVSPETVFRARMHLHLFSEHDEEVDVDSVIRRIRAGDDPAAVAAALDTSMAAVNRIRRLVDARAEARRTNYRFTVELGDLLDAETGSVALDRQVWDDRRALVDVHDD